MPCEYANLLLTILLHVFSDIKDVHEMVAVILIKHRLQRWKAPNPNQAGPGEHQSV